MSRAADVVVPRSSISKFDGKANVNVKADLEVLKQKGTVRLRCE